MTRDQIEALAGRWIGLWRNQGLDDFAELTAPDFVDRSAGERPTDPAAFAEGLRTLHRAFPNFEARDRSVAVDEAKGVAVVEWVARAAHEGRFLGVDATGRTIRFRGVETIRCKAGRVTERWGEWNGQRIEAQLREG